MSVREFIDTHYRHFNARTLVEATEAYGAHVEAGGRMMVTLAGAMSTAELGLSLAEMIRRGLVHAITCTGANLEEDLFNLVAHDHYVRVPDWRNLTGSPTRAYRRRRRSGSSRERCSACGGKRTRRGRVGSRTSTSTA
jgi:deoxyhypusine synthase